MYLEVVHVDPRHVHSFPDHLCYGLFFPADSPQCAYDFSASYFNVCVSLSRRASSLCLKAIYNVARLTLVQVMRRRQACARSAMLLLVMIHRCL